MLFDKTHILYMVISAIITAGIMVFAFFLLKSQKSKDILLKFFAVITVVIHFSQIYYDFFVNNPDEIKPTLELSMFIPAFACNVCMWLLVIVAFGNRENRFIQLLSHFVALGGIVCGFVGIFINENYGNFTPTETMTNALQDYGILKGLLSHSTMLAGSIYLLVGKYVNPRVFTSVLGVTIGLSIFAADGIVLNTLYKIAGFEDLNSMYLQEPPFENMPWLNTLTIGVIGILVTFLIGMITEFIAVPKEERWYSKIKQYIKEKKENKV